MDVEKFITLVTTIFSQYNNLEGRYDYDVFKKYCRNIHELVKDECKLGQVQTAMIRAFGHYTVVGMKTEAAEHGGKFCIKQLPSLNTVLNELDVMIKQYDEDRKFKRNMAKTKAKLEAESGNDKTGSNHRPLQTST